MLHLTFRRFERKESPLLVAFLMLAVADLEERYGRSPRYGFSTWKVWAGRDVARRAGKWLAKPENRQHLARLRQNRQSTRAEKAAENLGEQMRELTAAADAVDQERKQIDPSDAEQVQEFEKRAQPVYRALRRLGDQLIRAAVRVGLLLDPAKHGQRLLFSDVVRAALPSSRNARNTGALVLDPAWVDATEKARPTRRRTTQRQDVAEMRPIRPSDAPDPAAEMRPIRSSDAPDPAANLDNEPRDLNQATLKRRTAASRGAVSPTTTTTSAERAHRAAEEDSSALPRRVSAEQNAAAPAARCDAGHTAYRRAMEAFRRELELGAAAPTTNDADDEWAAALAPDGWRDPSSPRSSQSEPIGWAPELARDAGPRMLAAVSCEPATAALRPSLVDGDGPRAQDRPHDQASTPAV